MHALLSHDVRTRSSAQQAQQQAQRAGSENRVRLLDIVSIAIARRDSTMASGCCVARHADACAEKVCSSDCIH